MVPDVFKWPIIKLQDHNQFHFYFHNYSMFVSGGKHDGFMWKWQTINYNQSHKIVVKIDVKLVVILK